MFKIDLKSWYYSFSIYVVLCFFIYNFNKPLITGIFAGMLIQQAAWLFYFTMAKKYKKSIEVE